MLPPEFEEKLPRIKKAIEDSGAELVDLSFRRYGQKSHVTIIADKEGGITLDDCAAINIKLSPIFDEIVHGAYYLEVNSPGLDRPLRTESDFIRVMGQALKVFYRDPSGKTLEVSGKLRGVQNGKAEIARGRDGQPVWVPLDSVVKAVQEIKIR